MAARVLKLEEQIKGIGEMIGSNEVSMDEGSAGWRREGDGDEWQKWHGAFWIRVEQQNLNSRQRMKISRGLEQTTFECVLGR